MADEDSLVELTLDPKDEFDRTLIAMKIIHDKKKADYSSKKDRFSNFLFASAFSGINIEQTFEVLIGIKQARLLELIQTGKIPVNESIQDTLLDRAVYCVLALAYWKKTH